MPDKKDEDVPKIQEPAGLWDIVQNDRRRKQKADEIREQRKEERRKNPQTPPEQNPGKEKPSEDIKND